MIKQGDQMSSLSIDKQYGAFLEDLKQRVYQSRYQAARQVNKELITLYHHIGSEILRQQNEQGWGAKVIDQLSKDLRAEFPEMKGFGTANLYNMRRFAESYNNVEFLQQVAGELPWYHHILLMEKVSNVNARHFYMVKAIENAWSRASLLQQIELNLFERQGKAITNFGEKLMLPQSHKAQETLKDPYFFDFLSTGKDAYEREIEKELVKHIEKFLIELGAGFAFVGRQYHLKISHKDFFVDLLFYHLHLRCYVVIEIKAVEFEPAHAGQINFYLSAVDDLLKHPDDNPSIGIILCKTKDNVLAEYALRDMSKPIGLAEYRLDREIPEHIKTELPTIEELEAELSKDLKLKD
jgi:predicted nuclease of restriction endonuclease-like (RecB) superfamily